MTRKDIFTDKDALAGVARGVQTVSKSVGATMGARGRYTLIQHSGGFVYATKDGANTAKSIVLTNELEDMGAHMVIEAAMKTANQAGDGTTSTTVILNELVQRALSLIELNHNPVSLAEELEAACESIVSRMRDEDGFVFKVEDDGLDSVATISANGDQELGKLIADTVRKVGRGGAVSIAESGSDKTWAETVVGLKLHAGLMHPEFINTPGKRMYRGEDPFIAITDESINKVAQLMGIFNAYADMYPEDQNGRKVLMDPLVILCREMEGEALAMALANRKKIDVVVVRHTAYGDQQLESMADLCAITGGTVVSQHRGLDVKMFDPSFFGRCKNISIYPDKTIVVGGPVDATGHIENLRSILDEETNPAMKEVLRDRIDRLTGGVGIIYVGEKTDSGLAEKKDRTEDAVNAVQSAMEEGIVAGGGSAYLYLSQLSPTTVGGDMLADALMKPISQICENAGKNPETVIEKVADSYPMGYNVITGEFEDMVKSKIIDPAKVVRCAIENAVHVASIILRTGSAITIKKE
jgi:chaperonin GroEL